MTDLFEGRQIGFSRGLLIAIGAPLAVVAALLLWSAVRELFAHEPAAAPGCFGEPIAPGTQPLPWLDRRRPIKTTVYGRMFPEDLQKVQAAEAVCTPARCDAEAKSAYKSALFWWISHRASRAQGLFREYGERGLAQAQSLYATPEDQAVEQGLRDRFNAGRVSLRKDFRQQPEEAAILVFKGGPGLVPCRTDLPVKSPS